MSTPTAPVEQSDWLSVAVVAARLGTSARAVQKRCAKGTLPARRVQGERGEVWEVRSDAVTANREREPSANTNPPIRPQVRPQSPLPISSQGELRTSEHKLDGEPQREPRTLESEREHELKEEVRFLRGLVEQHQRSEAELRASLREALKAMPKQLAASTENEKPAMSGFQEQTARTPEFRPQSSEMGNHSQEASGGRNIEAQREAWAPSSLGELADLLEREVNQ